MRPIVARVYICILSRCKCARVRDWARTQITFVGLWKSLSIINFAFSAVKKKHVTDQPTDGWTNQLTNEQPLFQSCDLQLKIKRNKIGRMKQKWIRRYKKKFRFLVTFYTTVVVTDRPANTSKYLYREETEVQILIQEYRLDDQQNRFSTSTQT